MPFGDGTGPEEMGPMTGRGAGYCAGYEHPGYANMAHCGRRHRRFWSRGRRGFGRGMGMHHSWGYEGYWVPAGPGYGPMGPEAGFESRPSHKEMLENRANALRQELEAIEADLADMNEGSAEGSVKE